MKFQFDKKGFVINGERKFLVCGEIPYFRIDPNDLDNRLETFKNNGGQCVTSVVPWLIHEPEEGKFLFDDCPQRALTTFMKKIKGHGLFLILRPGPYTYSELINSGLPTWLVRNYPEIHARDINGNEFREESCSYIHPIFLEKVNKWYKAFSDVIRPYIYSNGGPIILLQLDNEFIGVQEWWGSIDYHPVSMGFGKENGRYPLFLKEKYQNIEKLNIAYESSYKSFLEVLPRLDNKTGKAAARKTKDYHDFYCETVAEYALILKNMFRDNGIDTPVCHNSSGSFVIPMLKTLNDKLGDDFLLGVDNYYALNITWSQNNPTPQYFMKILFGLDELKLLGNPPTVFELPGGSPSDIPPMLKEDMYTSYMVNLASGMKGLNYYIYAGGTNHPETSINSDYYDFQTFISPDGKVRERHEAFSKFNKLLHDNEWLSEVDRQASVQIGTEWQTLRGNHYSAMAGAFNTCKAQDKMEKGILLSLLSGKYSGKYVLIDQELDLTKPLILYGTDTMSIQAQQNIVKFIQDGGKVFIINALPTMDEDFNECTILKDFIGEYKTEQTFPEIYQSLVNGKKVYCINYKENFIKLPDNATPYVTDIHNEKIFGFSKDYNKGKIIFIGGDWITTRFDVVQMVENIMEELGAKPSVYHSNRTIYTTLFEGKDKVGVFLMNLWTGKQKSNFTVYFGNKEIYLGEIEFGPMEVKFVTLDKN